MEKLKKQVSSYHALELPSYSEEAKDEQWNRKEAREGYVCG